MEQMEQHEKSGLVNESYWYSVGIASLIFGLVFFLLSVIGGYITINSEPSGSLFGGTQAIFSSVACLVSGFGALLAVWHYTNTYDVSIKLGKGALIGLWVGIGVAIVMGIISQLWNVIEPDYNEKLMEAMIANYEAIEGLGEQQKQAMIDAIHQSMKQADTLWGTIKGIFFNAIGTSILNVISGMLGAKVFSKN